MAVLDALAKNGTEGFDYYPGGLNIADRNIHPALPGIRLTGRFADYRGTAIPADGWRSWRDCKAGHRPEAGGLNDQPEIWLATVASCADIEGAVEAWVASERLKKHRKEAQKLQQKKR